MKIGNFTVLIKNVFYYRHVAGNRSHKTSCTLIESFTCGIYDNNMRQIFLALLRNSFSLVVSVARLSTLISF